MKRNFYRNVVIVILISFFTLSIIPNVLGKTRSTYLTDFLHQTEIQSEGFKNGISQEDTISPEATTYALEILSISHDIDLQINLEDDLQEMFETDNIILYNLYFLLKSLNLLDYSIGGSLKNSTLNFMKATQQFGGGFSFSNTTSSASLSSTYFAYQIYSLLEEPFPNETLHKNWILDNNNSDGGYGGNSSLSSTLLNTYHALSLLDEMNSVNELANKSQTLVYLNSFLSNDSADIKNFGGYVPDLITKITLLSSTYYCIISLSILEESFPNKDLTINWILSRQSFQDGGFADFIDGTYQLGSSVISSYYAYSTLIELNAKGRLDSQIWMVEFNYWILLIIFVFIAVIAGVGIYIWRRRRI